MKYLTKKQSEFVRRAQSPPPLRKVDCEHGFIPTQIMLKMKRSHLEPMDNGVSDKYVFAIYQHPLRN